MKKTLVKANKKQWEINGNGEKTMKNNIIENNISVSEQEVRNNKLLKE